MKPLSRMTAEDVKQIVEEAVEKKLFEFAQDPDKGLKLRPEVRTRLRRTRAAERTGKRGTPASHVAEKLRLGW